MTEKKFSDSELYEATYGYKEQRSTRRFLLVILLLFLAFLGVRLYVSNNFVGVIVDGSSMNTTLYDGEQLLMRRTNEKHKAERGDVIVVDVRGYEECSGVESGFLIKRLIATAGDKLYCQDGVIYLFRADQPEKGYRALDESAYAYYSRSKELYDFAEYEVKAGEVFFLGDNRFNSKDSRYKEGHSSFEDRLYKEEDIYGVVPQWAIEHQKIFEWVFFAPKLFDGE
ncbi:MAG: signal peptidase I [Clostridia bacterium]|nr:signal peptidase I [Clostridia bacterium]